MWVRLSVHTGIKILFASVLNTYKKKTLNVYLSTMDIVKVVSYVHREPAYVIIIWYLEFIYAVRILRLENIIFEQIQFQVIFSIFCLKSLTSK